MPHIDIPALGTILLGAVLVSAGYTFAVSVAAAPILAPAPLAAQGVALEDPRCEALPFDPADVRRVVELELEVDGAQLVEGDAGRTLRYAPERCEAGTTRFRLQVEGRGEPRSPGQPRRVHRRGGESLRR